MSGGRIPEPAELADDIGEIKGQLTSLLSKLERGYVPRELYEARHTALRNEIALEFASLQAKVAAANDTSTSARALSLWCFGVIAIAVVGALVGFVATGGGVT